MKRILLSILSITLFFGTNAQTEYSDFTSTGRGGAATTFEQDYHCLGINPANLGYGNKYEGKKFTLGLMEFAVSAHTTALEKPELRAAIFSPNSTPFTLKEKIEVANEFATAGLALNFDMTLVGLSFHDDKIGGFGFSIRERVQWYSVLNQEASDFMFKGYFNDEYFDQLNYSVSQADGTKKDYTIDTAEDYWENLPEEERQALLDSAENLQGTIDPTKALLYSELLSGTRINFSWTREYNFSYGNEFEISDRSSLYGGIGLKYIQGFAIMDLYVEKGELINAYSAISPTFGIDYGQKARSTHPNLDTISNGLVEPVGSGVGADFGLAFSLDEKLKIGFSVVNVGNITWSGTVFQAVNDTLFDLTNPGFNSYNFFDEAEQFTGDEGVMEWEGLVRKKVALPSMMRFGVSYDFADKNSDDDEKHQSKADIGFDIIIPLNKESGNIDKPVIAIGGDFRPVKWLDLSTGFRFGGNYGFNIPLGIDFVIGDGTWEAGIATRDVVTYFTNTGPTLSLAMGVLRFRF